MRRTVGTLVGALKARGCGRLFCGALLGLASLLAGAGRAENAAEPPAELAKAIRQLQHVAERGEGHDQAQAASQTLAKADADQLPTLLAALDDANPLAANWLRGSIEAVVARAKQADKPLPAAALEKFLADRQHSPRARRLAYELLLAADPTTADRWLPRFLDDPSLELRRDGVAQLFDAAREQVKQGQADEAKATYTRALAAARDLDQIQQAVDALKPLGVTTDLPKQLGFLTHWQIVGPFDNRGGKGLAAVYPPEEKVDLAASYPVDGKTISWQPLETSDDMAHVDLNHALLTEKGVCGYAYAEFRASEARPAELRLGTDNAFKVWLNGKLVTDSTVYHSFVTFDQYIAPVHLQAGVNHILVKLCQNEQTEAWAGDWKFQMRVCDATGAPIAPADEAKK